jgi:hypothetical protein
VPDLTVVEAAAARNRRFIDPLRIDVGVEVFRSGRGLQLAIPGVVGRLGFIDAMRVHEVQVEEEVPVAMSVDPRVELFAEDLLRLRADRLGVQHRAEALMQAGVGARVAVLDERGGRETLLAQDLCEREIGVAQHVREVPDARRRGKQ